ncbi:hypothetical protein FOA52_013892 [Chlamydomonas sp. UWO 241]|nr:hypothetical protein FOA52_013892 [Chlamydomonas sp. UWO 241]
MGLLTRWLPANGGGSHLLHTTVAVGEQAGGEQTKRQQHIGTYASEEDAARAYDCAAVKLHGPGYTKRNFPGELISQPPVARGDKMRERKTSRFIGVDSAWMASLWDPQSKRQQHIGTYASEEDAARAYDCAAVKLHGPGHTKRNFPGELLSGPPVSLGEGLKERKTSRFIGVCRDKDAWRPPRAQLWNPATKRLQFIGCYASEEDATKAYDHALVELRGPGYPKRSFPNEIISEPPAARKR